VLITGAAAAIKVDSDLFPVSRRFASTNLSLEIVDLRNGILDSELDVIVLTLVLQDRVEFVASFDNVVIDGVNVVPEIIDLPVNTFELTLARAAFALLAALAALVGLAAITFIPVGLN